MLKNILNLEGAQQLSKKEQKSITGGREEAPKKCTVGGVNGGKLCLWPTVCHVDGVCRTRVEGITE